MYSEYIELLPHPGLVYMQTFLMHALCVSVYCTCVVCNRACYLSSLSLSPTCWSVRRNGLQALHLHPGVTDSSLYLCLSKHFSSHCSLIHTYFITLIPSPPVFCGPVTEDGKKRKESGLGSKEINTRGKPIKVSVCL